MTNPQKENGYVMIANEIIEALARNRISGQEMQCLLVVFRKTYGWNKLEDEISFSQFSLMTGLKRPTVARAIKKLLSKKIIGVIKKDNSDTNSYRFIKQYESWRVLSKKITPPGGVIKKDNTGVINLVQKVLSKQITTKDTITKDTIQKTISNRSEVFREAWDSFISMRIGKRNNPTDRAKELLLKKLEKLSQGKEHSQIEILEQSVERGWQGLFEVKMEEEIVKF